MTERKPWVTHTGYVRRELETNVFDAAVGRCHQILDMELPVTVSFSGGKDSTCVLMLMLGVARERGALPLEVVMVDEEVIDPDTIEYVSEVTSWPDVAFRWICTPIRHTLRARGRTHWYTWDPACRDVWARELPPHAITADQLEYDWDSASYGDVITAYYRQHHGWGKYISPGGIRAAEAMNRRRAVMTAGTWLVDRGSHWWAKPIYDWDNEDVWRAIVREGWPHSRFYDRMWTVGVSRKDSRVAPWGNVAGGRDLQHYPAFYPDFWGRAIRRLPELRAAQRYGSTKLMREAMNRPLGMTWQEYAMKLLSELPDEDRAYWANYIGSALLHWRKISTQPFPQEPIAGFSDHNSWKRICYQLGKNDRIKGASRDNL